MFVVSHVKRGGSRAAATSKMGCFVIIVNGTKHSIVDVATALDSSDSALEVLRKLSYGHCKLFLKHVLVSCQFCWSKFYYGTSRLEDSNWIVP